MRTLILTLTLLTACGGDETQADTEATGGATYTRASDESDRDVPDDQGDGMTLQIIASGSGDFAVPTMSCPDLGSDFTSLYRGEATIEDGVYLAAFSEAEATVETPSGCTLDEVTGALYTRVAVRGELVATTESCTSYCEGYAASEAEASCSGAADETTCRTSEEASIAATCTQQCTTRTDVLVAETTLNAEALAALNAAALTGAALGSLEVDLSFDRMEDASGDEVSPQ